MDLTQRFHLGDIITSSNEDSLKQFLINTYNDISWLFEATFNTIIGIGGTVRSIGKIDRKTKRYMLDIHHNYELSDYDIHSIYNSIKSKNLKQRKKPKGLSKDRAYIFVGPACAILTLMDLLKINKLIVSGKGLREGLLYDYINTHFSFIGDVLDFSLNGIISSHNININHTRNVYRISDSNLEPEINDAKKSIPFFSKVFDKNLVIIQ